MIKVENWIRRRSKKMTNRNMKWTLHFPQTCRQDNLHLERSTTSQSSTKPHKQHGKSSSWNVEEYWGRKISNKFSSCCHPATASDYVTASETRPRCSVESNKANISDKEDRPQVSEDDENYEVSCIVSSTMSMLHLGQKSIWCFTYTGKIRNGYNCGGGM